jgi:ABC-type transporter Mla subunit MlaD
MREVAKAGETIRQLQQQLASLLDTKAKLESERAASTLLQSQLPTLENDLKGAQTQATTFQKAMIGLQETATKLSRQVMAILPPISTTSELAYTKNEIALGLMQTCDIALIHPRLSDECQLVSDELVAGYGNKALPTDTRICFESVRNKLRQLKN